MYIFTKEKYCEKTFINTEEIEELLENTKFPDSEKIRNILRKSLNKEKLSPIEVATLLNANSRELWEEIFDAARKLKEKIYGNRIVLFAPLYIGNECVNDCEYCGFRVSNKKVVRQTLTIEKLKEEIKALVNKGHKRLIVVYGEHPKYSPEFIAKTIDVIYNTKYGNGEIRRVNVNAAPQTIEGYKIIKEVGIGTFQIFQETYHIPTYKKVHPRGPKSNFAWRLYGLDRAMLAGIDDVGIGALFGLYDWKFEVMGLIYHTIHLEERFGVGPHTISFPRIEPAVGTPIAERPPYQVNDEDFKKIVAVLRLAVPYTGLILTAREPVEIRREVLKLGVSQIDAGSSIGVGSYSDKDPELIKKSQFILGDTRTLDEVIYELLQENYIPSFCTACYRAGRTGEHFMEFAIPGFVKRFCTPNALFTLNEYLNDYASEKTYEIGKKVIQKEIEKLSGKQKEAVISGLDKINKGERDVRF
ncbi:thiamine biosynthesis protein ThiH [Thermosipho melanesiensis]|uniref:Biotin and thiamin synthesis associated n=2 Tax=Thermosipho melanesiensis TaxID=46541 RepID=A6LNE2_THEM4|nr:[FeFe] hydrogenase H-cluster radical SAM maturase HydG [Thermosipho melanesiensis]ABR31443.1 biotin and thiamin synthesis associated [Thermosipho melanesiensis BI429]APT74502.1 thiamine biosynthesis protein ThiH [Thermosipho melanesiensis]OOC36458.1 thiamine biosynthesis protein ThiH [Thermosipho melanesiensis]OOC37276.1 thiamine biosynthesis protein ThiH [Thermosipho melanesiensis]OOC38028.1 thiamine biosynthesis protein ThiH [Thermosipho melanesiensis]